MVFCWHFLHASNGYPVPFNSSPSFVPFSILDEGHTGVALFMTLSGYLFSKLLNGKSLNFPCFLYNRALRLFPLLAIVIIIAAIQNFLSGESLISYIANIVKGVILPTLPNGGWSITAESHFYLVLPVLLLISNGRISSILIALAIPLIVRLAYFHHHGEVQTVAYWTIIGRIDQFMLGIIIFRFRGLFTSRHFFVPAALLLFTTFYWWFAKNGGFYNYPSYPSSNILWVFIPFIEGLFYSILIAWYDTSFKFSKKGISGGISRIGEYSYSIYLLHFFFVFHAAKFINENIITLNNFYIAVLFSTLCFICMIPISYLSYRFVETPFLRFRKNYILSATAEPNQVTERPPNL